MRLKVGPGREIAVERRPCDICGRATLHDVTISTNGMGEPLAENAECRDHEEWANGRLDVWRNGEWVMVKPPDE